MAVAKVVKTHVEKFGDLEYHTKIILDKDGILIQKTKYRFNKERIGSIDIPYRQILEIQQIELDKKELVWVLEEFMRWHKDGEINQKLSIR